MDEGPVTVTLGTDWQTVGGVNRPPELQGLMRVSLDFRAESVVGWLAVIPPYLGLAVRGGSPNPH